MKYEGEGWRKSFLERVLVFHLEFWCSSSSSSSSSSISSSRSGRSSSTIIVAAAGTAVIVVVVLGLVVVAACSRLLLLSWLWLCVLLQIFLLVHDEQQTRTHCEPRADKIFFSWLNSSSLPSPPVGFYFCCVKLPISSSFFPKESDNAWYFLILAPAFFGGGEWGYSECIYGLSPL